MTDMPLGGTPGIDPGAIPAGLFGAPEKKPEESFMEIRLPAETEAVIAIVKTGEGHSVMVMPRQGGSLSEEQVANILHSLSHQIIEKNKSDSKETEQ